MQMLAQHLSSTQKRRRLRFGPSTCFDLHKCNSLRGNSNALIRKNDIDVIITDM